MTKISPKEWLKSVRDAHTLSLKDLQRRYEVDITRGLSSSKANELLKKYGRNQIEFSYLSMGKAILLGLFDKFSIVLWFSLVFFILLYQPLGLPYPDPKNLISVAMILLCFLVKSILIGVQELKLIKLMKSLQSLSTTPVSVLRDSNWCKIPATELVIGDVVEIEANQRVPADMRLVVVKNLRLDKSVITGIKIKLDQKL